MAGDNNWKRIGCQGHSNSACTVWVSQLFSDEIVRADFTAGNGVLSTQDFLLKGRTKVKAHYIKREPDKRPYRTSECPSVIITQEGMMKHGKLKDGYLQEDVPSSSEEKNDPRVRAALWAEYQQYELAIPQKFSEQEKKIQDMLENPLFPSECVRLLNEYLDTVDKNLELVRDLLTKCAKEMPAKYSSIEKLKNSSFDWIEHLFAREFVYLKPKADATITFVRSRYDVDNLLKE